MSRRDPSEPLDPSLILGSDEIINYPLKRATRGYATADVDELLDQLAAQTQDLFAELRHLRQERDELRARLAEASETESTLKKTLITAQRAAEQSLVEAQQQADELRSRAKQRAEEVLARSADQAHELREAALRRARADEADARRHRREVEGHIDQLRTFAEDHKTRLRHHLEQQLARLDSIEVPGPPPPPEPVSDEVLTESVLDVESEVVQLADVPAPPQPPSDPVPPPPWEEPRAAEDGDDDGVADMSRSLFEG